MKDTINFAELMGGLIEMQDVCGDNPSPQHFTPPPTRPFKPTVTNYETDGDVEIKETLSMTDYLMDRRIGSTELAMWHEMVRPSESKPCLTTGTAVHAAIEAYISGVPLDEYLSTVKVLPTCSRNTLVGIAYEIEYYCELLNYDVAMPDGMTARKAYADSLRSECESKFTIVSEKDAEVIRGIEKEVKGRHS